ncbi:oxalyl-CoA decarboxylase, partial [Xanthomonas citri pv. citri]|nr:oxalyl-CoA decarboxylase [Xanthomonas citri pv. citri]
TKDEIAKAISLIRKAERPLVVFGKGAAMARAEDELKDLVEKTGIPFLPTPMGKGLLPDTHDLAATAARSLAIGKCDVAIVVGARLNWP